MLRKQQIRMRKFHMSNIVFDKTQNKGPVIAMIGRRDTGKSILIRDLLFYNQDLLTGLVISGSEVVNHFFSSMIPRLLIHDQYKSHLIDRIVDQQKIANERYDKDVMIHGSSKIDPRTFIIMDDCLYDDKWTKDNVVRFIFMNGRHWKVMFIFAMQYPLGIGPVLRTNVDYVFILREPTYQNRKRIWENYASMFKTFEGFCSVLDQTTENYECIVIHNNAKSSDINDQVFWYKAQIHPPNSIRLCHEQIWKCSATMGEREEPYNQNYSSKRKREESDVVVRKINGSRY